MVTIIGAKKIGADTEDRRIMVRNRTKRRAEQSRDRSRNKIMELRRRYQIKVARNEEKMEKRKSHREKLGPTCVPLMRPRIKEKQIRSAIGSFVPSKPKFSRAKTHATRIFGPKFKLLEEGKISTFQTR